MRWNESARLTGAARSLTRTALSATPPRATPRGLVTQSVLLTQQSWITAIVLALLVIVPAIAFLPGFHDLVAAERASRCWRTKLLTTAPSISFSRRSTQRLNLPKAVPVKQFLFLLSSMASRTFEMFPTEHPENLELFGLSPLVADANIM